MKGAKKKSTSTDAVLQPSPPHGGASPFTAFDPAEPVAKQQQKENHGVVEEDEGEEEEEEEEEEQEDEEEQGQKGYDQFGYLQIQDGEAAGAGTDAGAEAEPERPKLAEGFYEIETVRRRRVRKGQTQYLIKWRGWPETANTWEPVENLASCSDIIEAFDERFYFSYRAFIFTFVHFESSGKKSSRGRKRKHVASQSQGKKKQLQTPTTAAYSLPAAKTGIHEEPLPFPRLDNSSHNNGGTGNMGGFNNVKTTKQVKENESAEAEDWKPENELDLKLSELRGTGEGDMEKFAGQFEEARVLSGGGQANGISKVNGQQEPAQSGRCTGAKRRKSGSVKRFKKDSTSGVMNDAQDGKTLTSSSCGIGQQGVQNTNHVGSELGCKDFANSKNVCPITAIIKPLSYSASESNNGQDVSVTFMAIRCVIHPTF
ncbi:hypothetical protein RJ639_044802 [Escallonia herrerae]|uniref:Chromo domain-containing protein n=1 Tax=Escallonia herrerae TaxID=1293975 RepID=A0AA89B9N5_9ASTE|nr:hypothetical protein RJ639_044802 [Escallonia herrerae]